MSGRDQTTRIPVVGQYARTTVFLLAVAVLEGAIALAKGLL